MKQLYKSPVFEVLWCEMNEDVIMASIEETVPDQTAPSGVPSDDDPVIPDNFENF